MLSKAEQNRLCELYLEYQAEYNRTHDQNILWNHIRPLLVDMIGNTVKKLSKGHFICDYDHRLECQVDRVLKRYIDNPQYNRDLPLTIAYWEAVNMLYSSGHDKLTGNYSHDLEYENASYTEEEKDIKLVDIKGNRVYMDFGIKQFNFLKKVDNSDAIVEGLEKLGWKKTD